MMSGLKVITIGNYCVTL